MHGRPASTLALARRLQSHPSKKGRTDSMRFGFSQALFALVATTASVQAASAQQAGDPESPPAQGAASSATREQGLSQINGQLVPVGTHNEYYYDFKRWNVSTNPVAGIMGLYSLQLSYGLTDNVAVRGDVSYYNLVEDSNDDDGFEVSLGVPLYLRRTYQGAFVEGGLTYRHMTYRDGGAVTGEDTTVGPHVLVGWHHTWDSGLNVSYAFGLGRDFSDNDSDDPDAGYDTDSPLFVNGYFRVGYAF
jgi:hypothetical protein